jgi:aspartate kinase
MIVMKFGGTSTQDASAMRNVAGIVGSRIAQRPVVVISAIAQATNTLERSGGLAAGGRSDESLQLLNGLIDRHRAIAGEIVRDPARKAEIMDILGASLAQLTELVRGVAILRELTPRTLDAFYAYGELLSSRLVAAALAESGIDAAWIDTADFMVTDELHGKASPLEEVVHERLTAIVAPLARNGTVPVTQGFIGVTAGGRRTTMGRESSDYSGAVIGAALDAEDIQIWTDVDGVLTADPRIIERPLKITTLSFQEAYELSFFGAKVLHPNTMLPAIAKGIPIHIYNSRRPAGNGTLVGDVPGAGEPVVKSVAYRRNVALLRITPRRRQHQFVLWEHVYNVLAKFVSGILLSATSEYTMSIVADAKVDLDGIARDIGEMGDVERVDGQAILCIVGTSLRNCEGLMFRTFGALGACGINGIAFGPSSSSMILVVDDARVLDAVRSVHDALFGAANHNHVFEPLSAATLS